MERVEVGEGGLDEVCCEPHDSGLPGALRIALKSENGPNGGEEDAFVVWGGESIGT